MLEVIVTTIEEAKTAYEYGASRLEVISAYGEGGITPSYGLLKEMQRLVPIPLHVMIRPHSRGFVYSEEDLSVMYEDILVAQSLGVRGVVLGTLDSQNRIHTKALEYLLKACEGLYITFHRAIEETNDLIASARILANYPSIQCILTSGGKASPENNLDTLKQMQKEFGRGDILVGGGVNIHNIPILRKHGLNNIHIGKAAHVGDDIHAPLNRDIFRIATNCNKM